MTDIVEQAARVIGAGRLILRDNGKRNNEKIAQALADAGLLHEPARTVPTRDEIVDALVMSPLADTAGTDLAPFNRAADAVLELLADQPTVAEVKAQALEEAADAWHAENAGTSPRAYRWLQHRARQIRDGK